MRRLLLGITLLGGLAASAQSPTSPALGFNVFLEKGAKFSTNETDGPVALGGDLTLAGNYQVSTNYTGTYTVGGVKVTLLIGGRVIYQSGNSLQVNQNGYVKIGDSTGSFVWYKDPNNATPPMQITTGAYNASPRIQMQANSVQLGVSRTVNPVFQGGLINFASAFTTMKAKSLSISSCTNNASLTNPNGQPISNTNLPSQVKINLNNGINVLNVSGTDLNNVQVFTYNTQPSASKILVINVNAPGTFNWTVWNQAGIGFSQCPYILYNFYNTTTLNIKGNSTIEGTVFAPFADIIKTVNQSNIEGQVIAQSYYHSGGENHYAPFTPNVLGCSQPTVASFTMNDNSQCVYNSFFQFSSTSSGSAPFTYFWDFGDGTTSTLSNPSKTYALAGTYQVKLKVTGLGGTDSVTQSVLVDVKPVTGFSVNDTIQELTGNNFVFTTTNVVGGNTYQWFYGDNSTPGATVHSSKTYQATGPYQVMQVVTNQTGCSDTTVMTVIVACDSVGSGNGGGLESESLGDLVGRRDFNNIRNSVDKHINYQTSPVFVNDIRNRLGKKATTLTLSDMLPAALEAGDVLRVTSPTDLLSITSALEVLSVDYTRNNQAKAVVLAIKTKEKAYSHTKYICDRLRGGKLISIDSIRIKGYNFIRFVLVQEDGTVEFGTSFVAGTKLNRDNYTLQTNWLLSELQGDDTLYTFQVWATQPEYTNKLVADIIENLDAAGEVVQTNTVKIPTVYITHGYRRGQNLVLHIKNTGAPVNADLVMEEKLNEQAGYTQINETLHIETGENKVYEIEVNDGYEYNADILVDNKIADIVYMADGNWGLDFDRNNTSITNYATSNEPDRNYKPEEFSVYRNASVSAVSNDYVLLYKGIKQGNALTDLRAYSHIYFFAKGNGKATVTLTRDSIVQWQNQFKYTVDLTEEGKMYTIALADFKSDAITAPFNPWDVRMISFARASQSATVENMELSVGNIAFIPSSTGLIANRDNKNVPVSVMPNPTTGRFTVNFNADKAETLTYKLTDILGRVVATREIMSTDGVNVFQVDVPANAPKGIMFLSIEGKSGNYSTVKIVVQ